MTKTYFQSRQKELLRAFDREVGLVQPILAERYGGEFARTVLREARMEFETLIPAIPFIGGPRNPMQSDLIESVHLLAFHRVMKAHAKTAQETSAIIDRGMRFKLARYPRFLMRLVGKLQFSRIFLRRLQNLAMESQKRKYPENSFSKSSSEMEKNSIGALTLQNAQSKNSMRAIMQANSSPIFVQMIL